MRITFKGAAMSETGSQYLLEVNVFRLQMECGLFQHHRAEMFERNRTFRFKPKKPGCIVS